MKYINRIIFFLTVSVAISCSNDGIMHGVPVQLVNPEMVVSVVPDTTMHCDFPEVLNCSGIQIVDDTVLVFNDQISEHSQYHFKAYSTVSFEYLGGFINNGRGPGEMIDPRIVRSASTAKFLSLKASQMGQAYAVDVLESLRTGKTETAGSYTLPANIMDWLPLPGNRQFRLQLEGGESVFHVIGEDGSVLRSFHPYRHVAGDSYMTYLSSLLANNGETVKVAEVMALFPQINIIDTGTGEIITVAVDRSYRQWENVINRRFDMNTVEYYGGISPTPEYIIATYKGQSLGKLNEKRTGSSIHVFDWNGNFLCKIKVSENIGNIAYDSRTGHLYCNDKSSGRIIRYDLSGILD